MQPPRPDKPAFHMPSEAFLKHWQANERKLQGICRHFNLTDAMQDILQEVYLKGHRRHSKGDGVGNWAAYLAKITRNACIDWIGQLINDRARRQQVELAAVADSRDNYPDAEQQELLYQLTEAIHQLSTDEREVVLLWSRSMPVAQIADYLGLHRSTVYHQIERAFDRLRRLLGVPCPPRKRKKKA